MTNTDNISGQWPDFPIMPTTSAKPATYFLYGLRVRSDLPLPLAPIADNGADLVICRKGLIPRPDGPAPQVMIRDWERQGESWLLHFHNVNGHVLDFQYDVEGSRISICQSYPEWQDSLFVLMCAAMAAAFNLRGAPVLHATSLVKDGGAFLLMGSSGVGKSTLAAALGAAGLSFHADDVAALSWCADRPIVQAGYPRLKITPQTGAALGWPANTLLSIFVTVPKYREKWVDVSALPGGFHDGPAHLKAVYLLSGRSADLNAPRLEVLSPVQGALAMARHLYGQPWLEIPAGYALSLCTRVAGTTPVYRLQLPEGLDRLRLSARAVMTHMER